jgi:hypothetical protein
MTFNPGVQDRSGEILGAAGVNAANTTAQANVGLVNDIGSALMGLAGSYGEMQSNKAKGRAFKDVFKVVAPSVGISMDQLEDVAGGKLKNDMDWYKVSETIGPWMPSLINMQLGKDRLGVQQDQPFVNQGLQNARNLGAGNVPYGADPANTVPLPTDDPLPAVASTPPAVTARPGLQNMTREQWDAMNEDLVRLGRKSRGPYPY